MNWMDSRELFCQKCYYVGEKNACKIEFKMCILHFYQLLEKKPFCVIKY